MSVYLKGPAPKRGTSDRRCYWLDVTLAGRRERLSTGTRDKGLALRKEQAVIDALIEDIAIPRDVLKALASGKARSVQAARLTEIATRTLKEAFSDALNDRNFWKKKASVKTIRANCRVVCLYLGEGKTLNSVTQADVDTLVDRMEADGYAPSTINRKLQALMAVLKREAKAERFTAPMPEYKPACERGRARQFVFTLEDEELVLSRIRAWDEMPDIQTTGRLRKRDGHDYHDLFVFLADVGCRLSQAINVRWSDIERSEGHTYLRFWRSGEQKGGMVRTIPCTRRVAALLERRRRAHMQARGPFAMLTKTRADKLWNRALKGTHLEAEPECVPHALRHTCATRMLAMTGDIKLVQEWIGHRDITTTARVYAKVMIGQKINGVMALENYRAKAA